MSKTAGSHGKEMFKIVEAYYRSGLCPPWFLLSAEDKQKYLSLAAKRNHEEKQGDFFSSNANETKPSFNLELGLLGDAY